MFKLFNHMQKTHGRILNETVELTTNLGKELVFLKKYAYDCLNNESNLTIVDIFNYNIENSKWVENISTTYDLPKNQVVEWLNEKKYQRLLKTTMTCIKMPNTIEDIIKKIISVKLNFSKKDLCLEIWAQEPGQMAPLHYDRPKHRFFNVQEEEEKYIKRMIVFLDDQKPGQIFYLGDQTINWKSGDVLEWDQTAYAHGSANFGYHSRPILLITGVINH